MDSETMIQQDKKKGLFIIIIMFGILTIFWYSMNPVSTPPTEMPDELKIRDGQTLVYYNVRMEYLYQYKMPDNSTRNVIMVSGTGSSPFAYEVREGDYINLFDRYNVVLVTSQYVLIQKVIIK